MSTKTSTIDLAIYETSEELERAERRLDWVITDLTAATERMGSARISTDDLRLRLKRVRAQIEQLQNFRL